MYHPYVVQHHLNPGCKVIPQLAVVVYSIIVVVADVVVTGKVAVVPAALIVGKPLTDSDAPNEKVLPVRFSPVTVTENEVPARAALGSTEVMTGV